MFKSAATKLAHNSAISALTGNSGSRPLQEVIATEKLVLQSLQRLSADFGKSSDALKAWASGEGEDLTDTFSACSTLLNHWVLSLTSFASRIASIRECLKAVRAREEALDEIHRRRRSLASRADSADKKLNRMSPENKNFRQQTDLLTGFREQIHALDEEIVKEEADLGDWKRLKAREWMGMLFGGLLECSEKGAIVATFGCAIVGHVSTEKTQPGHPRTYYTNHSQVEPLVVEAERELDKISFVNEFGDGSKRRPDEYRIGDISGLPPSSPSSPTQLTHPPQAYVSSTLPDNQPNNPHELSDFGEYNPYHQSQTYVPGQRNNPPSFDQQPTVGPAGSNPYFRSSPLVGSGFTPGHQPHFSQSSVRSGSGFTPSYPLHTAPALHPTLSSNNTSGSGPILDRRESTGDTFSSSIAKALGDNWGLEENGNTGPPGLNTDAPPSSYPIKSSPNPSPPNLQGISRIGRKPVPTHIQEATNEDDEVVSLPRLNQSTEGGPIRRSGEGRPSENSSRGERKIRWGSIRDVDMELEKRHAEDIRKSNEAGSSSPDRIPRTPSPTYRSRSPSPPVPQAHPYLHQSAEAHPSDSPTSFDDSQALPDPDMGVEDEVPNQPDGGSLSAPPAPETSEQTETSESPLSPPLSPAGRKSVSPPPSLTADTASEDDGFDETAFPPPPLQFADPAQDGDLTPTPGSSQPTQSQNLPPALGALPPSTSVDSTVSDPLLVDDAYHTPPDYLRDTSIPPSPPLNPVSPPPVPQMSQGLNSSSSTPATAKVSAAMFRRPGIKGPSGKTDSSDSLQDDPLKIGFRQSPGKSPSRDRGDGGKTARTPKIITPLNLKKSLPAIPSDNGSPLSVSSPLPDLRTSEEEQPSPGPTPPDPSSSSPEYQPRDSTFGGDNEFGYVSTYLNDDEGRESVAQRGGLPGDWPQQGEGYGSGRYVTRLDK